MKKFISAAAALVFMMTVLAVPVSAAGAGSTVYTNTRQVADNLSYTQTISLDGAARQAGYMLELGTDGDAYPIVMACDTIYGRLTVGQMVTYAERMGNNVLAAVNTDFFSMQTGVPIGLVVEDGVYKSSSSGFPAVGFRPDGGVVFSDAPVVTITLDNLGGEDDTTNAGQSVTVHNFNKYRADTGGLYLFSNAFSTVSTRTSTPGWFVVFDIEDGTPRLDGTMTLTVAETLKSDGAIEIGEGQLILSAANECGYAETLTQFSPGDRVTLTTACSDPALADVQWATGGGDLLVDNGAVADSSGWDKYITAKNPRTAFGVRADGTIVTYVCDGNESTHSAGLTLTALAEQMRAMGCVTAINFDGGGSSVMSVRQTGLSTCAVMNKPSDGTARKCATYLLFVTDKTPNGRAAQLGIENDGVVVLAGSSVPLSLVASDGGYKQTSVPADTSVASSGLGTVSGGVYKAGMTPVIDTITLRSPSTGAVGTATIHVVSGPTALNIRNSAGNAISGLSVWPGDTVQLTTAMSYYGLPITIDDDAVTFSVTTGYGTVTSTGVFTAAGEIPPEGSDDGRIRVTVGDKSAEVPINITGFSDTADHWAKDPIRSLWEMGIVTGVTDHTYEPESPIKRGDFVLMLYRAAGKPAAADAATFTDVLTGDYYEAAIAWAESNNIATGDGTGLFRPQDNLTREQAFALVYRALAALGITKPDVDDDCLGSFADAALLSDYAFEPTAALVTMGIVDGSGNRLNPSGEITRAQMAKLLYFTIISA